MKNIAILGGAFDPPTVGHIEIAKAVLELPSIDEVWFMPCHTHRFGKETESSKHRLAMILWAVRSSGMYPDASPFTFELYNEELDGSTYATLKSLLSNAEYKDYNFSFTIGLDNADNIKKWARWEEVIKLVPFIVLPRDGEVPSKDAWYSKKPHRILNKHIPHVSSTLAREYLRDGELENTQGILDEDVYDYIIEKGLYRR